MEDKYEISYVYQVLKDSTDNICPDILNCFKCPIYKLLIDTPLQNDIGCLEVIKKFMITETIKII